MSTELVHLDKQELASVHPLSLSFNIFSHHNPTHIITQHQFFSPPPSRHVSVNINKVDGSLCIASEVTQPLSVRKHPR
ncbi:hypothetical protein J6590_004841 [Homalodisca vitripennis]|nr:hypothetical protein J6590_004841 [Homalodisca vitripennis]